MVGTNEGAAIRVPAVSLLDLVRGEGLTRIDAVKLDVEGAEDLILEPFLRQAPPALHPRLLIVEDGTDLWQTDLSALLTRHGYRRIAKTRLNLVFEREGVSRKDETGGSGMSRAESEDRPDSGTANPVPNLRRSGIGAVRSTDWIAEAKDEDFGLCVGGVDRATVRCGSAV